MPEQFAPNGATLTDPTAPTKWEDIAALVWAVAERRVDVEHLGRLDGVRARAETVMLDLLDEREGDLAATRRLRGHERRQVQADIRADLDALRSTYRSFVGYDPELIRPPTAPSTSSNGHPTSRDDTEAASGDDREETAKSHIPAEVAALQLSWDAPNVVAWTAGARGEPEPLDGVLERLSALGAMEDRWTPRPPVVLPSGQKADAVAADISDVLGWLVALDAPVASAPTVDVTAAANGDSNATTPDANAIVDGPVNGPVNGPVDGPADHNVHQRSDAQIGQSAAWLRLAAVNALAMVAQGRFVPLLRRTRRRKKKGQADTAEFAVEWQPASADASVLAQLADTIPGAVVAAGSGSFTTNLGNGKSTSQRSSSRKSGRSRAQARVEVPPAEAAAVVDSVLGCVVNALVADVADRLGWPDTAPDARTAAELGEAFLSRLDGATFTGASGRGIEVVRRIDTWAKPVLSPMRHPLTVKLSEPDSSGRWQLEVLSVSAQETEPVEIALVSGTSSRRADTKAQLTRLERLIPALMRPGGRRRGEVLLTTPEAWELMSETGPALAAAGFDVQMPAMRRDRPPPALRLTAEAPPDESKLGVNQLTAVSWTAMFGDVELTMEEMNRLAAEARPLVRSRGRWVAIDHSDLNDAREALASRADQTEMTGAQMLRQTLGLEGDALDGGVSIAGSGWAVDLLRASENVGFDLQPTPAGFFGSLRTYQAEALAWLDFLDEASLGGCLALDMGLGKTPIMLAMVGKAAETAPTLVIAPPAVVGNWAAEAARFTPGLKVLVHHGASRASQEQLALDVARVDLVITTYGTAVRDIHALCGLTWERVVVDEAQVIKNHNSHTAKTLRKLEARTKIALTGTPIENGLRDLWAIIDFTNPGLVGERAQFVAQLTQEGDATVAADQALTKLNGVLVFRRTKAEPAIAAELPDRIDEVDQCAMTPEQIALYQAVQEELVAEMAESEQNTTKRKGAVLAAITALKQICNHPLNFRPDDANVEMDGRSGKLARLNELLEVVFAAQERVLIFTHFATWGERLADYLTERYGMLIDCYHGGLSRGVRDEMVERFSEQKGAGALVLSLKAGGTGLNLTAASHVVLFDRWWNPAVEDQARDRAWRIGQTKTVVCHRLVCTGTVDERVEEVVAGKRMIADMALPKSSSLGDLTADQLRVALGIEESLLVTDDAVGVDVAEASQ